MQAEVGQLDPFDQGNNTGTLGRIADELSSNGYSVNAFSIDTDLKILEGRQRELKKASVSSDYGFKKFNPSEGDNGVKISDGSELLNGRVEGYDNVFSNLWSSSFVVSPSRI